MIDYETKVAVCDILNHVFGTSLKLLHPFMPFITTEIYSNLVSYSDKDLMVSKWPRVRSEFVFDKEEKVIESIKEIIVGIRNARAKLNVHPSKKSKLIFVTSEFKNEIEDSKLFIEKLGFANEIVVQENKDNIPENAISVLADGIEVYIPFEDIVDIEEEKERLQNEIKRLQAEVERGTKMLSNPGFVNKAPEAKVNEEKEKLAKYQEMLETTTLRLKELSK